MANYDSGAHFDDPNVRYDEPSAPPKNMNQNKISAVLAAQAVTDITTAINTIRTKLPFLINLSPDERKRLRNVTEESQGSSSPRSTSWPSIPSPARHVRHRRVQQGRRPARPFQQVASAIGQLDRDVDDTLRALHSDLYSEFLDIYALPRPTTAAVATMSSSTPSKAASPAAHGKRHRPHRKPPGLKIGRFGPARPSPNRVNGVKSSVHPPLAGFIQ